MQILKYHTFFFLLCEKADNINQTFEMFLMPKIDTALFKIFLIIYRIEKVIITFLLSKKTLANVNDVCIERYVNINIFLRMLLFMRTCTKESTCLFSSYSSLCECFVRLVLIYHVL